MHLSSHSHCNLVIFTISFVSTLDGKTITVDVDLANDTIADIKETIHAKTGLLPDTQMLTFCGSALQSDRSVASYRIEAFSTIDLSLKLLSKTLPVFKVKLSDHLLRKYTATHSKDREDSTTQSDKTHIDIDFSQQLSFRDLGRRFGDDVRYFVHGRECISVKSDAMIAATVNRNTTLHTKSTETLEMARAIRFEVVDSNSKRLMYSQRHPLRDAVEELFRANFI